MFFLTVPWELRQGPFWEETDAVSYSPVGPAVELLLQVSFP